MSEKNPVRPTWKFNIYIKRALDYKLLDIPIVFHYDRNVLLYRCKISKKIANRE